jgi:predicted enzyme related to lactoylglutathione lyase
MEQQLKSAAAWFEIPCADLDRAQRFYETILGCRMKKNSFGDDQELMCICRSFGEAPLPATRKHRHHGLPQL